jgi:hypothetical protein
MEVSGRVLIGFGSAPSLVLDGGVAKASGVVDAGVSLNLPVVGDVVSAIETARNTEPVLPGVVGEANIADGTLDPATAFSRSAPPLDARRGGTGIGGAPEGAIVVTGDPSFDHAPDCSAAGGILRLRSHLGVGQWRYAPKTDPRGTRTLAATGPAGVLEVDLLKPSREIEAPAVSIEQADEVLTIEASGMDPSAARICHFYWTAAPGPAPSKAAVALRASASALVGPDGTVRHSATNLPPGPRNAYAVAEGARRNFSAVAAAPTNASGAIFVQDGALDPRVSFSRASVGTRVNPAGIVETVPANAPRFDHHPLTLEPRGLLIEEARTNLYTNSEALTGAVGQSVIVPNDAASPSGASNADRLFSNEADQVSTIRSLRTWSANKRYTVSFFAKSAGQNVAYCRFQNSGLSLHANLLTGETLVSPAGTPGASSTSTAFANGWRRFSVTFAVGAAGQQGNMDAGGTNSFGAATVPGVGASGVLVWGFQIEEGSFATSYIPTGGSPETRADDVATVADLASWFNPNEGTFGVQFETVYSGLTAPLRDVLSGDGLTNVYMRILYLRDNNTGLGSTDNARNLFATGDATGAVVKAFTSYSNTLGRAISVSGNAVARRPDIFPAQGYPLQTVLYIGGNRSGQMSNPGNPLCGWVRRVVYYDTLRSDAELVQLSAS